MKRIIFITLHFLFLAIFLSSKGATNIHAQTCSIGSCCGNQSTYTNEPTGCYPLTCPFSQPNCTICTSVFHCVSQEYSCGYNYSACYPGVGSQGCIAGTNAGCQLIGSAPPPPPPTNNPNPGNNNSCAWCTNQNQCMLSGCNWQGTSSYCGSAGDGCCNCTSSAPSNPPPACGNGVVEPGIGEECDYGYTGSHNYCPIIVAFNRRCMLNCQCAWCICEASCGQSNACGESCGTNDLNQPASPGVTPANGSTVTVDGSNTVSIFWTIPAYTTRLYLQRYPAGTGCGAAGSFCGEVDGSYPHTFTPLAGATQYTYSLTAINDACSAYAVTYQSPPTVGTFTISSEISGNFYLDADSQATTNGSGLCVLGGAPGQNAGTGASLTGTNVYGNAVTGNISGSSYTISMPPWTTNPNNILNFTPGSSGGSPLVCTCPAGCSYSGLASPQTGVNFFLVPQNMLGEAWWQAVGGAVNANATSGIGLQATMPDSTSCSAPGCLPHLITEDSNSTTGSDGFVYTGGSTLNITGVVTERQPSVVVQGSKLSRIVEGYDFFFRQYSLGLNPADDFSSTASNALEPTTTPASGQAAYFHAGDLTIDQPWTIGSNEQRVIFIDGNLTITNSTNVDELITVDQGGFLALIVSGNITIAADVGHSTMTNTTANLNGIFIADGTITIQSSGNTATEKRFIGGGSFIGHGGISLERDLVRATNRTTPAEQFVFRPDFIRYIPEQMARPQYVWQETN